MAFPLKNVFADLFTDEIDIQIRNYAWIEYISRGDSRNGIKVFEMGEAKEPYYEHCDNHQQAHVICHNWVAKYICPDNDQIVKLLREAADVLNLFLCDTELSQFIIRTCQKGDKDNAQKNFYHQNSAFNPDSDPHREMIAEFRTLLKGVPGRKEHGSDAYFMRHWGDFVSILKNKVCRQILELTKPIDERQINDPMASSIVAPKNILSAMYRYIGEGVHFNVVRNPAQKLNFLELFEKNAPRGFCPMALLGSTNLNTHTTPKTRFSWTEVSAQIQELIGKALRAGATGILPDMNSLVTLSGYGPGVIKFKADRIRKRVDQPLGDCVNRELQSNCDFKKGDFIDDANFQYIRSFLVLAAEDGAKPVYPSLADTRHRIEQELFQTVRDRDQETTDFSTAIIFGVGALCIFMFMR